MSWLRKLVSNLPPRTYYPITILAGAGALTILGISGSSIGQYDKILGDGQDSSLVFGEPRGVRADEWLIITSKTIAQSFNDYDAYNENMGVDGENVSVRPDIPTNSLNTIFRPQNWAFLVIPLENAIAYKWWFFTVFATIVLYYFALRFFTRNLLLALLMSLSVVAASLPQWTYREFVFLPIGFGLLAVLLADWLMQYVLQRQAKKSKRDWKQITKIVLGVLGLSYSLVAFVIVLYPPMQIIVALVLAAFYIDVMLRRKSDSGKGLLDVIKAQKFLVVSLGITGLTLFGLFTLHKDTLTALAQTEHPGVRHFASGWSGASEARIRNFLIGGAMPFVLQKDMVLVEADYFNKTGLGNQSEAANYPWLITPIVVLLAAAGIAGRRLRVLPWATLTAAVFVAAWMLVRGLHLPVIDQVQSARWNLAVGLLTFLLIGFLIRQSAELRLNKQQERRRLFIAAPLIGLSILVSVWALVSVKADFSALIGKLDVITFSLIAVGVPVALLFKRYAVGLGLLAGTLLIANVNVNPLYRGVDAAINNPLVNAIEVVDTRKPGTWLMAGNAEAFEQVPLLAGAKSLTTHFSYPQDFWKKIDNSATADDIYNRVAHTRASLTDGDTRVYLHSVNSIGFELNPCDVESTKELGIDYVVTLGPPSESQTKCLKQLTQVIAGNQQTFYLYATK